MFEPCSINIDLDRQLVSVVLIKNLWLKDEGIHACTWLAGYTDNGKLSMYDSEDGNYVITSFFRIFSLDQLSPPHYNSELSHNNRITDNHC